MAFPLLALLPALEKVLDRVIPDKTAAAAAKMELYKMEHEGEFRRAELDLRVSGAQTDINKVEAGSGNAFAASWRPLIGYICGAAFGWNWVGLPVALFGCKLAGIDVQLEQSDMSEMLPVLMGMLGLGAMRSYERVKQVIPNGK